MACLFDWKSGYISPYWKKKWLDVAMLSRPVVVFPFNLVRNFEVMVTRSGKISPEWKYFANTS